MSLIGSIIPQDEKNIFSLTGPGTLNIGNVEDGVLINKFLVVIVHGFDSDNLANIKIGSSDLNNCNDIDVITPGSTEYIVNKLCDGNYSITFNQTGSNIVAAGEGYIIPYYERFKS